MTTKSVSSNYYNSAEDLELADGGQDDLGKRTSAASASNFRTKWTNEEFEEGCGLKEPDHRATTSTSPFLADFDPNECDLNDFEIIDYLNDEFRDINPAISVNS